MPLLSTTLTTVRQGLLDYLRLGRRRTTTADGAAGGGTFIDTTYLVNFLANRFDYWYAFITSGTYSGQERRVATSSAAGTITLQSSYGGTIVSGVTYELLPWPVAEIHYAINEALQEAFPNLPRTLVNEDLVTGNALPNGAFEDFIASTTLPDYWALTGAGASTTKDTSNKKYGLAAVSLTRAGTDCHIQCSTSQWPPLLDLAGETPYFECWVKTSVASRARLAIVVDGGTPTYSSYHTGGGNFELLRKQASITGAAVSVALRGYVETGNATAYFDNARLLSNRVTTQVLPGAFVNRKPERVLVQVSGAPSGNEKPCDDVGEIAPFREWPWVEFFYDNDGGRWLMRWLRLPSTGYKVRLEGSEFISEVSAETDTVPLEPPQLKMLYPLAATRLLGAMENLTPHMERLLAKAKEDYVVFSRNLALSSPRPQLDFGNWK